MSDTATMRLLKNNREHVFEPLEDSRRFFADPRFIHFIGMIKPLRPGVEDCVKMLEFTHYQPGTPRNDLFGVRLLEWEGIFWVIISIPLEERGLMEKMARVNGLQIANGIPMIFTSGTAHNFPVSSPQMFSLENTPGHPVYKHGFFQ